MPTTNLSVQPAAHQGDSLYCRECLIEYGTDAEPLWPPTTIELPADIVSEPQRATLADPIYVHGAVCDDHDVAALTDIMQTEFGEGWNATVIDYDTDYNPSQLAAVPADCLDRDHYREDTFEGDPLDTATHN